MSVVSSLMLCGSLLQEVKCQSVSRVQVFAIPWTIARQALLPMGFSRLAYWSRWPLPSPGDLPSLGIEPLPLACAGGFFIL